jgi:hypothetical protein
MSTPGLMAIILASNFILLQEDIAVFTQKIGDKIVRVEMAYKRTARPFERAGYDS